MQGHDEVIYCANNQPDTCGCLEDDDQCDSNHMVYGDTDRDADSDDEQIGKCLKHYY